MKENGTATVFVVLVYVLAFGVLSCFINDVIYRNRRLARLRRAYMTWTQLYHERRIRRFRKKLRKGIAL